MEYENNTGYFENRDCRYYPCHKTEHVNCLFCYCPMYPYEDCLGDRTYLMKGTVRIKNCTDCLFPHKRENYEKIIQFLSDHLNARTYRFFGWENAGMAPLHDADSDIRDPKDLYDLLSDCWSAETCAPRMRASWNADNKTYGQCSITAFLVQDLFGGKVYGVSLEDGNLHCYNVVGDRVFDLTSEQFGEIQLDYSKGTEQSRRTHFEKAEKKERYELLKELLSVRRRKRNA